MKIWKKLATELLKQKIKETNQFEYKIITKQDFIKHRLNTMRAEMINKNTVESIKEAWNKHRKGYDFMIAIGEKESMMFYSVEYFNENIVRY